MSVPDGLRRSILNNLALINMTSIQQDMRGSSTLGGGPLLAVKTNMHDNLDNYVRALLSGYTDGGFNQPVATVIENVQLRCNELAFLYDLLREENYKQYVQLVTTKDFKQYSLALNSDNIVHKFLREKASNIYNANKPKSPFTYVVSDENSLRELQKLVKNLQVSGSNFLVTHPTVTVPTGTAYLLPGTIPYVIQEVPLTVQVDAVYTETNIKTAVVQLMVKYVIDGVASQAVQSKTLQPNAVGTISLTVPLLPTMYDVQIFVSCNTQNVSLRLSNSKAYFGTSSEMVQTGLFTQQTNILVVRRLILLYMYISMFMLARRLEADTASTTLQSAAYNELLASNVTLDTSDVGPGNDFIDMTYALGLKMNTIAKDSNHVQDMSTSVTNMRSDITAGGAAVVDAKRSSSRLTILSWVFFVIFLGVLIGAVIMHMTDDPASKGMIAITILAVAVSVGILTAILKSYFWTMEPFNNDIVTQFYTEVDKYLENTITVALMLQNHKAYDLLDDVLTKGRAEMDNTYEQMRQGVRKMDNMANLMDRKRIYAHARISLFVNLMIIIAATAFLIGIVHNPAVQKLIYVVAAIFTAIAMTVYIVDTKKRVHTRSPQFYWAKPTITMLQ